MRRVESTGLRWVGAVGALLIAVGAAAGCDGDATPDEGGGDPGPTGRLEQRGSPEASPSPANPESRIDLLRARDAALEEFPNGVVYDVELEEDSHRWTVEVSAEGAEHALAVDARSGDVSELEADMPDGPDADLAGLSARSLDTAVRVALDDSGGSEATEASLDKENGRRVWKIEVDDGRTVAVDTETGEVVATDS